MAEIIKMPTLGFDMEEGTMGTWLKNVGDPVKKGDVLAEIESDKVTQELQARAEGILLAQFAQTGDQIPVGADLGVIGATGEDISGITPAADGAVPAASEPETAVSPPTPAPTTPTPATTAISAEFPAGVKATPVARRLATERSIDLTQINGSGPGGRIRRADVESFVAQPQAAAPAPAALAPAAPVPASPDTTEVPLTRMRQAIARRMVESKTTVPDFYITSQINMEPALALRKQINAALPPEDKVTVNDLIVKAAALSLREYPAINASFGGDKLVYNDKINVGTAVAIEGGLLTIVQKDTDTSSISKIARDHKGMIARARDGKVQPDDIQGATFTVSNLGPFEVENFIAIVNPPNAAILAVASAQQIPVVVDGELAIGTYMKATLSADHRVTDGAEAAKFMQTLKGILENALRLLL
ncbi:MAG: 2-oxo acid dehydrogenase subunit E2 [Chloroflexi bacterium]|nr:2-oxo acid dehydrogenase subunit E2 [Chloroflexota bacterium]